jgi:hypothetical protein
MDASTGGNILMDSPKNRNWFSGLRRCRIITALAVILPLSIATATVVYRYKGTFRDHLMRNGGVSAYKAPIEINGSQGTIELFGFDSPPDLLLKKMAGVFDLKTPGITTVLERNKAMKVLVTPTGKGRTTVFLLSLDGEEKKELTPPVSEMPFYAKSRVTLSVVDNNSGAALYVSEAYGVNPDQVRFNLDQQLHSAGWSPALPGASYSSGLYFKDSRTCLVFVTPPKNFKDCTRITVLHKIQGVE